VGLTDITPGALINPGSAIVTLDNLDAIRVDFQIPDRYVAAIRAGQPVSARVDAYPGETFHGKIVQLDTRIDENTRALTARAEFPNPTHRLKPGLMVRVAVAQGAHQAPSAPESAVIVQGDSAFVLIISRQGGRATAEQRPIVTGARQNGVVEVRDGVAAGDRVVADGLNKIQPGQPVKLVGEVGHDPKPAPAAG
jgi:membrane fusion protein, multidrug efflux system